MAMNVKDFKNVIKLQGCIEGYYIKKDPKAKRKYDGGDRFKKGDTFTEYTGFIDVRTSKEDVVRINVQSEWSVYNGEPTKVSLALEAMSNNEILTYAKTGSLTETPLISFFGKDKQGNDQLKFNDNYYPDKTGGMVETIRTDLGYAKFSIKDPSVDGDFSNTKEFQNEFIVCGVITDLKEEMVKDEETGRVVVKVQVPYAQGSEEKNNLVIRAMPLTLIAGMSSDEEGEFDMAELILDEEDEAGVIDLSWQINGHIHGYTDQPAQPKQEDSGRRRLGRKTVDTNNRGKHIQEFLIDGIDILGEDGEGELFSKEDLKDAINARRVDMENKKKKAQEDAETPKTEGRQSRINSGSSESTGATPSRGGRDRKRSW